MATTIQSSLQLDETPKIRYSIIVSQQRVCEDNRKVLYKSLIWVTGILMWISTFIWISKLSNWFIYAVVKVNKSYSDDLFVHCIVFLCSVFGITVANQGESVCTVTSRSQWLPPLCMVKIWKSVTLLWVG